MGAHHGFVGAHSGSEEGRQWFVVKTVSPRLPEDSTPKSDPLTLVVASDHQ